MWALGTELQSCVKAKSALNYGAVTPTLEEDVCHLYLYCVSLGNTVAARAVGLWGRGEGSNVTALKDTKEKTATSPLSLTSSFLQRDNNTDNCPVTQQAFWG